MVDLNISHEDPTKFFLGRLVAEIVLNAKKEIAWDIVKPHLPAVEPGNTPYDCLRDIEKRQEVLYQELDRREVEYKELGAIDYIPSCNDDTVLGPEHIGKKVSR